MPSAPLTKEGHHLISQVRGARQLDQQDFSILRHSPLTRASETAELAVPGGKWAEEPKLGPCILEQWDDLARESEVMPTTLGGFTRKAPELLGLHLALWEELVPQVLGELPDGGRALLVSHRILVPMGLMAARSDCTDALMQEPLDRLCPRGACWVLQHHSEGFKLPSIYAAPSA